MVFGKSGTLKGDGLEAVVVEFFGLDTCVDRMRAEILREGTSALLHVAHPQPKHQARTEGAAMAVAAWLPLSAQREERAGQTRHRHAKVSDGYFCQWVLLAWTPYSVIS